MANRNDLTVARMAAVLIPVVVGSLLGLMVSLTTNFFTVQAQREEVLRKEYAAHLERAMMLSARYSNDLGRLLGIGFVTKGDVTPNELAVLTAPSDTLLELSVVISLYFPDLKGDVDQIIVEHGALMHRFDDIVGAHDLHGEEDAAAFSQRMMKETSPTMERVRALMQKLSKLADPGMGDRG